MRNHNDSHGRDNLTPIPDTGKLYETRDASLKVLAPWLAFLFVFVFVAASIVYVLFKFVYVTGGEEKGSYTRQLPAEPKVQADPVQDIKNYREKEAAAVEGYGRNLSTHTIYIPIDRAMTLVLPELPVRPGAGTVDIRATTQPNVAPVMNGKDASGSLVPPMSGSMDANGNGTRMGQPGMNPEQSTSPTPNAPGVSTPSSTNGNGTNSGGGLPLPAPNSTGTP